MLCYFAYDGKHDFRLFVLAFSELCSLVQNRDVLAIAKQPTTLTPRQFFGDVEIDKQTHRGGCGGVGQASVVGRLAQRRDRAFP